MARAAEQLPLSDALAKEAKQRLSDCQKQKAIFAADIEECYWFAAPHRHRSVRTNASTSEPTRPDDASEASTTLAREVSEDFATEVEASFLTDEWARFKPGFELDEDEVDENTLDLIETHTTRTLKAVKASNFRAAFAQAMVPDGAVGTVAVHIDDTFAPGAFHCQPIPLRELEVNVGPNGIDDRFIIQATRYRHLPAKLPGVELPKDVKDKAKAKPNDRCVVKWGWWRDWTERGTETWTHVILVGDKLVKAVKLSGTGSCGLIVGRFNADPMFAFGNGPMIKALPDLRTLDESMALMMERFDLATHPPFGYPDDGVVNFEGGIEAGKGYPMAPGSGQDFVKLFFEGNPDLSFIMEAGLERRVRRAHHADRPEQRGDTPPSATQWLDEMVLSQRQISIPAATFWDEFCAGVFLRFHRLLQDRGRLDKIEVNGSEIMLEPYNPSEKAKEQQQVQVGVRMLEIIMQFFPEIGQALVDARGTIGSLQAKMGDKLVKTNSQQDMDQAVGMLAQVAGAAQGQVPGAPGGMPPEGAA